MDCIENFGRFIVALINIIFMIISIALLSVGCLLKFGWDGVLKPYVQPMVDGFLLAAKDAGFKNVDGSEFDLGAFVGDIAIPFIVIGALFFILAIFGCVGACCKVKWMILGYAILCIVILAAQIIFVIVLFTTDSVVDTIKTPLVEGLQAKYTGFNGTNIVSLGWNFFMVSFKCCGMNDYKDFDDAKVWHKTYHVKALNVTKTLAAPVACCKLKGTFPDVQPPENYNCTFAPTTDNSNYKNGCYSAIIDFILQYKPIAIGVGVGILLFQLILITFALLIYCGINKETKVRPV